MRACGGGNWANFAALVLTPGAPLKKVCPSIAGGNNYWPSSYSPKTKLLYIPAMTACMAVAVGFRGRL